MMYNSDGKLVMCKCGKPAGAAIICKEHTEAWCSECSPLEKYEAKLVYIEPTKEQIEKYNPKMLESSFEIDLSKKIT